MNRLSNDLLGEISRYLGSSDIQTVAIANRNCSRGIREAYRNPEFRKPIQERNRMIQNLKESMVCHGTIIFIKVDLQKENFIDHMDIVFETVCTYSAESLIIVSEPKVVPTEIQWETLLHCLMRYPHHLDSMVIHGLEVNAETYNMIKDRLRPVWNQIGMKYIGVSPEWLINNHELNRIIDYFMILDEENDIE